MKSRFNLRGGVGVEVGKRLGRRRKEKGWSRASRSEGGILEGNLERRVGRGVRDKSRNGAVRTGGGRGREKRGR
jgi:hypothetical protein